LLSQCIKKGIGALIIRKTDKIKQSLSKKTYFGGGTISMALIDENKVCYKNCSIKDQIKQKYSVNNYSFHTFLEDGTISYLEIVAVGLAIKKFKKLTFEKGFSLIQDHTIYLINYCIDELTKLEHFNAQKLVEIYRNEINSSIKKNYGPIVSFNLKNSFGAYIGFRLVDKLAQENHIYLRTGCFCNIGACQMYMKHLKDNNNFYENFRLHGHECGDHIDMINDLPTGAIRISFGYCSIKQDVDTFIKFLNDHFVEHKYDRMNNIIMNIENIKINKIELNKTEKQYFKISNIYIYPIKSCAPMKIKDKWCIKNGGFTYDRNWLILDNNYVPLTQKRFKLLTKIRPFIDLDLNILKIEYGDESFEIQLQPKHEITENKLIHIKNMTCYDEGDVVSEWLSRFVFKTNNKYRLARIFNSNHNDDKAKISFSNKADYLLINENSIRKLKSYLNSTDEINKNLSNIYSEALIDEFLCQQFRPNIVVSTILSNESCDSSFDEEFWINLKILNRNIEFDIVENCTRCQMININQSEFQENVNSGISSYSQMLLTQLYKLKSNSKFGIYLSKKQFESNKELPINVFGFEENISSKLNNELSIGDIGIALKYNLNY
jgi:molybdenum cofactor sulfurtransferase